MLDITKYEEVQMEYPNVVIYWDRSHDKADFTFRTDPRLLPLIREAAVKFPMWKFYSGGERMGINRRRDDKVYEAYRLAVTDGREHLGVVSWEYAREGKVVYCVENERISSKRERGRAAKTKDIAKAVKIMAKSFGAKTLEERVNEAYAECVHKLHNIHSDKGRTFTNGYSDLFRAMQEHVMTNWEQFRQIGVDKGVPVTVLDSLPEHYENYMIAKKVKKCLDDEKGVVVTIHGNDYAVRSTQDEDADIKIYSTDNLPDRIKFGVGMLKLVEPRNIVANIGYKIDDTSFFVVEGET